MDHWNEPLTLEDNQISSHKEPMQMSRGVHVVRMSHKQPGSLISHEAAILQVDTPVLVKPSNDGC
jgi:hypothetical protein